MHILCANLEDEKETRMTELDLVTHISSRGDMMWNIVQWWISVSFGLMIASYIASEHLTKGLATLSISMYSLYSVTSVDSIIRHSDSITAGYQTLELLAAESPLTPLALGRLDGTASQPLMPFLCIAGFLVTNGFVIYCLVKRPSRKL